MLQKHCTDCGANFDTDHRCPVIGDAIEFKAIRVRYVEGIRYEEEVIVTHSIHHFNQINGLWNY